MISFPNAKINLGLSIIRKRSDGYHDLETVFYPVQLSDILEINEAETFWFSQTGNAIDSAPEHNLVVKAYRLLEQQFKLKPVHIHLHKLIPMGAGLGGGSSDAAFTLMMLNELFELKLSSFELQEYAVELGSDCPFFIQNRPVFAQGRGEVFSDLDVSLKGFHLLLVKPEVHVPTAAAYSKVEVGPPEYVLQDYIVQSPGKWAGFVKNDFEKSVFPLYPEIEQIKLKLIEMGALYASMSGSGSSVFGIFEKHINLRPDDFETCFTWQEELR